MAGRYMQFSPSGGGSPQLGIRASSAAAEHDKYVSALALLLVQFCASVDRWLLI
jgi:hypothetical protein